MKNLIMPSNGPRIPPLALGTRPFPPATPDEVGPYVRSEYDKSIHTWGIPNNLIRTMGWHPQLCLTEIDYANSFIFDEDRYIPWPNPANPSEMVLFPAAGFCDRVTKELAINLVSLLNRSRYSITHHTAIAYGTIRAAVGANSAEQMLLRLVDGEGNAMFTHRTDLYSPFQIAVLSLAEKLRGDAHDVTDEDFAKLRELCLKEAESRIASSILASQEASQTSEFREAYVNGMLVEITWCIVHFAGLLNKWFTVLKICDETDPATDGLDFVTNYNNTIPESIKARNNELLRDDGWG